MIGQSCLSLVMHLNHCFSLKLTCYLDLLLCVGNRRRARNKVSDHELYNVVKIHEKEKN